MRTKRLNLNLPPHLVDSIRAQAESHHRTVSGEVTSLLVELVKPSNRGEI